MQAEALIDKALDRSVVVLPVIRTPEQGADTIVRLGSAGRAGGQTPT